MRGVDRGKIVSYVCYIGSWKKFRVESKNKEEYFESGLGFFFISKVGI